jgi:hypothetical protein
MVATQRPDDRPADTDRTVTVVIEDTVFRVLHGAIKLGVPAHKNRKPVTREVSKKFRPNPCTVAVT